MKTNRLISTLAAVAVSLSALTGCSMAYGESSNAEPLVTQNVEDSENVLETLRWADEIRLKKAPISFNDQYDVFADDEKVGEIRGQYIYLLGDTFSLFSNADNLVASEAEGYRVVNHKASLYDYNNDPAGEIKEDLSLFLAKWTLYDVDSKSIGKAQQNFNIVLDFTVKNAKGVDEYRIQKTFISIGSELTITRLTSEPNIHAMNAVWLAAIANEIDEARQSEDDNN